MENFPLAFGLDLEVEIDSDSERRDRISHLNLYLWNSLNVEMSE